MRDLLRVVLVLGIVVGCSITPRLGAHEQNVSGRWRVSFAFDSPVSGTLELKQQGETVTGTLNTGFTGGDMPIEGEYADGELTFSGSTTTGPHPGMQLDFTAVVETNTTMKGTLSWQVGDFQWTAERVK